MSEHNLCSHKINMKSGHGCYLVSDKNEAYLDLTAGTFNLSLGYQNEKILKAVQRQMSKLTHCSSSFEVDSVAELQTRLLACSNNSFVHVHTKICSGSTAMEGAIKYAMFNTGRREIITFRRSHHGQTFYTMNMSGFSFRSENFPVAKQALHCVSYPADRTYPDDSGVDDHLVIMNDIKNVLRLNSQNQIAAIVIEPILASEH